ncbi:hypothetical protein I203_102662 [Kwoniella mangroviensis CBS 8507]|uniref:uncharacterized protein n=1 Tax=Kwoniella mangroviensis CBS 8507 TaxID=1296122 RepID=UPI00304DB4BF
MRKTRRSFDGDEAGQFMRSVNSQSVIDQATEIDYKALARKLDKRLIPILFFTYALQCIDKSCLGYASVFILSKDLGLKGKQYSWLSSLFYFGYLICEYPTTLLSQKFPLGRFIGLAIVAWGGIHPGRLRIPHHPYIHLDQRIVLYTKEQVLRTGAWAAANGFGSMVGGIIAFGMGHVNTGISGWKWIFVINGLITVIWGVLVFLLLPPAPMHAKFLTESERVLAVHRIRSNNTGILNRHLKWSQVREALNPFEDPQGLLLFLVIFCNEVLNGGFGAFGTLTIKSFGFNSLQSTLIYIPQGFINMICILFGGWLAQKIPNGRIYVSIGMLVPTFIGLLLQIVLPRSNVAGLLTGVYLFPPFATCLFICLSLPGVNSSGYTKRITLSSYAFLGYALGNISGPFMVKTGETPAYRSVFVADIICIALQAVFLVILRIYYVRENRRRDKLFAEGQVQNSPDDEFADKTDLQLPGFRYVCCEYAIWLTISGWSSEGTDPDYVD